MFGFVGDFLLNPRLWDVFAFVLLLEQLRKQKKEYRTDIAFYQQQIIEKQTEIIKRFEKPDQMEKSITIKNNLAKLDDSAELKAAQHALGSGDLDGAILLLTHLLELPDIQVAQTLYIRGATRERKLDYPAALHDYRLAVELQPDNIHYLNTLANLYSTMGRYAEAEPLYQKILDTREKILGSEHPSTVAMYDGLADLYTETGRYAEAEPLYQKALAIREKILKPEHPDMQPVITISHPFMNEEVVIRKRSRSIKKRWPLARKPWAWNSPIRQTVTIT